MEVPPFRWRDVVNGHALFFIVLVSAVYLTLVVGLALLLLSPTGKDDQYIVVLPPWAETDRIFEISTALNGRVIGLNTKSNAYLLYVTRPEAADELYRAGAWLVLDPKKVGGVLGCGPTTKRRGPRASGQAEANSATPTL